MSNKMRSLVLIGGGVRCGKSRFALTRARALGERRVFVATAEALDDEMGERVAAHARERGADFLTREAPRELCDALQRIAHDDRPDVVVIDCITLWLSNLLLAGGTVDELVAQTERLVRELAHAPFHTVLVTNEVGMGVVPESALGRRFRDASGAAHQRLAAASDEIYFGVLGSLLRLRPDPITLAPDPNLR